MARTTPWYSRVPVWGAVLLIGLFLLATNSYPSPARNLPLVTYAASDGLNYRYIADNFPHLPPASGQDLPHHHMQRFAAPWLVGGVSAGLGIDYDVAFRLCVIVLLTATAALLLATISALNRRRGDQLLLMAVFLLQPVATRYYLAFPSIIPDVAFVFGLAAVVRGMALERLGWLFAGLLIAATARQTALLILPGLALWALMVPAGARYARPQRLIAAGVGAALVIALYLLTGHYSEPFSQANVNSEMVTGLVRDHFSFKQLVEFVARGVLPFLLPIGLLLMAVRRRTRPVNWPLVAPLLVLVAVIAAQPLLGGPVITGINFARLALLSFPALLVALAVTLDAVEGERAPATAAVVVTGAALAIGSMHHITSIVGQDNSDLATAFALVTLAVSVVVLAATWRWRFAPRAAATG